MSSDFSFELYCKLNVIYFVKYISVTKQQIEEMWVKRLRVSYNAATNQIYY